MAEHQNIYPGPVDSQVLTLQDSHRSSAIWDGEEDMVLECKRADGGIRHRVQHDLPQRPLDYRIQSILVQCGFYGAYRVGFIRLCPSLITALVERWREETHTFHLPIGECTVTLQDVTVLLGLRVDGLPITGVDTKHTTVEWQGLCLRLLGREPHADMIKGGTLKLVWLAEHFSHLPHDATEVDVLFHARAHMLLLIGGFLLPDKTGNKVKLMFLKFLEEVGEIGKYSWASATLAWLYREMCKASLRNTAQIGGCLTLLQLWVWERFPSFRSDVLRNVEQTVDIPPAMPVDAAPLPQLPLGCNWHVSMGGKKVAVHVLRILRDQLDALVDGEFIWEPYQLEHLPTYCINGANKWRATCPLICFDVVEWYLPQRTLRQFGRIQDIPAPCDTDRELHNQGRQGRAGNDWAATHYWAIDAWNNPRIVQSRRGFSDEIHRRYMQWYVRITRLQVGRPKPRGQTGYHGVAPSLASAAQHARNIFLHTNTDDETTLNEFREHNRIIRQECLDIFEEEHRAYILESTDAGPSHAYEGNEGREQGPRTRGARCGGHRPRHSSRRHASTSGQVDIEANIFPNTDYVPDPPMMPESSLGVQFTMQESFAGVPLPDYVPLPPTYTDNVPVMPEISPSVPMFSDFISHVNPFGAVTNSGMSCTPSFDIAQSFTSVFTWHNEDIVGPSTRHRPMHYSPMRHMPVVSDSEDDEAVLPTMETETTIYIPQPNRGGTQRRGSRVVDAPHDRPRRNRRRPPCGT